MYAYVAEKVVEPVETIEEHTRRVARETGVEEDTLWNLVLSESLGGERMVGDDGDSCGLVHINKNYYPEEFKNCMDNDFSLRFAANLILEEREWLFTSCNCYQYAKYVSGYKLPLMADIEPNTFAFEGALVIFDYDGIKHLAYIEKFNENTFTVREANYVKCSNSRREVDYNDENIQGFWAPGE